MKINKPLIFALLIVLGIIIGVWLVKRTGLGPDSGVNQFFNTPVNNGVDQECLVENYLRENISQLSPEPEVLGGTFYVTNLEFLEENSVRVEYEDGHIALSALANYSINDGLVEVNSFELID